MSPITSLVPLNDFESEDPESRTSPLSTVEPKDAEDASCTSQLKGRAPDALPTQIDDKKLKLHEFG